MPMTAYQLGRRPTRHFKSQSSRSKPLVNDFPKGRLAASRFALWRTSLSFNRQKSSIVKEPSFGWGTSFLFEELASSRKEHPYYTTSRFRCKWGFKRFFIFFDGHGDGARTRISRIKSPLQNHFCYTVLKSSKRLTLDLWFIHCPQRETRLAIAVFTISHCVIPLLGIRNRHKLAFQRTSILYHIPLQM